MFETADHSKTKQLNALKSFGRVISQDFKQYIFLRRRLSGQIYFQKLIDLFTEENIKSLN